MLPGLRKRSGWFCSRPVKPGDQENVGSGNLSELIVIAGFEFAATGIKNKNARCLSGGRAHSSSDLHGRSEVAFLRKLFGNPAVPDVSIERCDGTRGFASPDCSGFAFIGVRLYCI